MAFLDELMAQIRGRRDDSPSAPVGVPPEAPPTAIDPERAKLSMLTKLLLSLQAPNTPLSKNRGSARGQLFVRGLVGGANKMGSFRAYEEGVPAGGGGGATPGGISAYQQLLEAGRTRDDAYRRDQDKKNEEFRERQFQALLGQRTSTDADRDAAAAARAAEQGTDNKRADAMLAIAQAGLGLRRNADARAAQRMAMARNRAATANAKMPGGLKEAQAAELRAAFAKYSTESDFDATMLDIAVDDILAKYASLSRNESPSAPTKANAVRMRQNQQRTPATTTVPAPKSGFRWPWDQPATPAPQRAKADPDGIR